MNQMEGFEGKTRYAFLSCSSKATAQDRKCSGFDYFGKATPMTNHSDSDPPSDPDELKGPGGMTLRQIHEQVQRSVQRDREAQAAHNAIAPKTRWQRWVRYVWGRSGRR